MKTALVYDRVNKWGGAERVMLALHEMFPDAPLYTSVYDKKNAEWARVFKVRTSFLQNFPHIISNHEFYPYLMPLAFEQFDFDEYDLVISVTSEAAKGIITKPKTKHICYCLTPTRYLWSGYGDYFKNEMFRFFSYPAVAYLRKWDKIAANRPDLFVAASNEVKKRIKKYYDKDSEIIYPPLYINESVARNDNKKENGSYFLVVSRLIAVKRIDLAIEACNELKLPLKIIGTGKDEQRLKNMAGATVEFAGNVCDEELIEYYSKAKALIHPGIEDFGLTVIEAQKYGTPVIAFGAGGALETIIENKTGLFFDKQTKDSLVKKLIEFEKYKFRREDCEKQAQLFNFKNFKDKFLSLVGKAI